MNYLIMEQRPTDKSKEEWANEWSRQAPTLDILRQALLKLKAGMTTVKASDYDTPNHYVKLAASLEKAQLIDDIIAMLPEWK